MLPISCREANACARANDDRAGKSDTGVRLGVGKVGNTYVAILSLYSHG